MEQPEIYFFQASFVSRYNRNTNLLAGDSMFVFRYSRLAASVLVLSAVAVPMAKAEDFTADQKKQVEKIINDYLMENPEVITKSLQAYQEKQMAEQEEKAKQSILDNMKHLTAKELPSIGKEDAPITIVEFFDYNCGYCKRALPDIQAISKENDKVRFVFIEMPILGPSSGTAAQYALAAHNQGKYFEFHSALMEDRAPKEEEHLIEVGAKLGLDTEKLKADANSQEIKDRLANHMGMANKIGIQGTPAFIINGKLFRGYIGKDGMDAEIKTALDALPKEEKKEEKKAE